MENKKKYKVIFLDIDGVLAPLVDNDSLEDNYFQYNLTFKKSCVKLLLDIVKNDPEFTRIVLSSTWVRKVGLEATIIALASNGINGPYFLPQELEEEGDSKININNLKEFYGIFSTPKRFSSEKCHEINFFLSNYEKFIKSYVILDDQQIFNSTNENLVLVNPIKGLQEKDKLLAIDKLNNIQNTT